VNYWLHAKHLMVNGEKMSKSKGNFFTLRDLLEKGHDPMAIRHSLLAVHYKTSLNFTLDGLKESRQVIEKLDNCYFQCLSYVSGATELKGGVPGDAVNLETHLNKHLEKITEWLGEDLNVAAALAQLSDIVNLINACAAMPQKNTLENMKNVVLFFKTIDRLLGFDIASCAEVPAEIRKVLGEYSEARKAKDFAKSDALRKEIAAKGWLVKDGRPGEPSTVKKIRRAWELKK
jgi:cysteinyl-tRNA synthetase